MMHFQKRPFRLPRPSWWLLNGPDVKARRTPVRVPSKHPVHDDAGRRLISAHPTVPEPTTKAEATAMSLDKGEGFADVKLECCLEGVEVIRKSIFNGVNQVCHVPWSVAFNLGFVKRL